MNRIAAILLVALLLPGLCRAQTSFPMICAADPLAVQRGKSTDVMVHAGGDGGGNLYGAYKVLFSGSGITGTVIPPDKGWPAKDPKKPWSLPTVADVKVRVTVAPDAALGVREFRMATERHGVSTVGQLIVTDSPETPEVEPNTDEQHAQPLPVPGCVDGVIRQDQDIDWYKLQAPAGKMLVFTIYCARAENKIHDLQQHADPVLTLCEPGDKEIAQNDDYYGADSLLAYTFQKAGTYYLKVRDVNYQGNPFWAYHLTVSDRPYVTGVVPCAVTPGQSAELQVTGYNLGDTRTVHLDVPSTAPPGIWHTELPFPQGASNLISLLVTDTPQIAPATGASKGAPAVNLPLPGGASGVLAQPNEIDKFSFHAGKGEAWAFEVTARRLWSAMDSELKLLNSKGDVLAENDDAIGKDSRIEWTAPDTGNYVIEVRDITGGGGPTYFYNLTATRLSPDFQLRLDPDRAMIAPGNSTAWFAIVDRKNGFNGPVKLRVDGLPEGVSFSAPIIPPGMSTAAILLTAAPRAKIDMSLARVIGTADLPGPDGKPRPEDRDAQAQTEIYIPGGGRGQYPVETAGVAVTEPNDLAVTVDNPSITIAPGGTAKINVTLHRRPDYTAPVTLDLRINHQGGVFADPLPPGITVDDASNIGEKQDKGTITIHAAADAKPISNWPLAVMANVSINFVMKVWYAAPVSLTVMPAPAKK